MHVLVKTNEKQAPEILLAGPVGSSVEVSDDCVGESAIGTAMSA